MKLAHIINPVKVTFASDLHVAQPITFESIRVAKEFANRNVDIELYTVCFEEDRPIIPPFFTQLPNLTSSVKDKLGAKRKLPYIREILQALYTHTDAEYLVYTNMDISLMPQFYTVVSDLLTKGHDALMINRRGISTKYTRPEELPYMYGEMGAPHPGFDCFVFKRSLLPKLVLADVCVGVPFLEVTLVHNLIAFAENLKLVDDLHLTFHIGSEVMPPVDNELYTYNRNEYEQKIYPVIKRYLDIRKFPYSRLPFYKRIFKWVLNPVFRTHQVAELEGKGLLRRLKFRLDSVRFEFMNRLR